MAYEFVDPPHGLSYAAPMIDFGIIGNLPDTYRKAQDQKRQADVADAFKNQPLPLDPATGLPDYGKIMQVLASKGGIDAITKLAPAATEQALIGQAGQISPLLQPGGGAAPPPGSSLSPPQSAPAAPQSPDRAITTSPRPLPNPAAPSAGYTPMANASGSVVDIVSSRLPQDSQKTGAVIANIAKAAGVDPNAALSPEQSARVTRLADAYAARTGARTAQAALAAGPAGPVAAAGGGAPASFADRFAAATGPAAAPQAPLVPQVPLPKGFTDPQQAIMALRTEAARLSTNPYAKGQVSALNDWATRIESAQSPLKVGQYDTIVSPQGQTLYQGPMAKALSGGAGGVNAATLDADAERYRQTGTLPPNMGRGVQGQQESAAIRARAAEHEVAAGGDPSQWATRWQEYRARGVGMNTGERVRASREENLNLILKVTDSAIPAALEQSQKVWRSGFVPLNKIIQRGEVMTSDPELRAFGMSNLQLAEGWARAMNPTGVMRESDREKALEFLTTADSPETYRRLVMQLKTQITRERDSIKSGAPMREGDKAPAPGVPASSESGGVVRWERGPDGKLRPAQ